MKKDWTYKVFEDCIEKVKYTTKLQSKDYLANGDYPIISQEEELISGCWNNASDVFCVERPLVVFGDHTRVLKYVDFDFVLGADGVKILLPIQELGAKFLYYFLKWYNVPNLGYSRHYKLLKEISLPIPPLSDQELIVRELDAIHGILEKKQEQLRELDHLAQAIFYDMFGDPISNPKQWEVKKLGEVCSFSQGMQAPIEEQYEECKEGYTRFLRIIDFTQGTDAPRYVLCKDEKYILHEDEIAIVRYGTPGFVCYGKYGAIANNLFKIIPTKVNLLDYHYLIAWLSSDAFQSIVKGNQYGAALQAIKFSTIQNIPIILPPLSLQQSFAAKIEAIEAQKTAIRQSIREVEALLAQRMDHYFN